MKTKIEELRRKRAALITEARTIVETAESEDRDLSGEERQQFESIETDTRSLEERIGRMESMGSADEHRRAIAPEQAAATATAPAEDRAVPTSLNEWRTANAPTAPQDTAEYRAAFYRMLTVRDTRELTGDEQRALSKATAGAGANLVPTEFANTLIDSLRWLGNMRSLATVITTGAGEALQMPTVTAHGTAAWTAENAAFTESDETFGQTTLNAFKAATIIKISEELLEDAAFDLEAYIRNEFGLRIGVLEETAYIVGDGTGKPTGITTQASAGLTAASGTAVTGDELIDLAYTVGPQYRMRPGAGYLVSDTLMRNTRKLKASDGQYLWQASLQMGQPDMFNGFPIWSHPDIANPAINAVAALFGDFSYYHIRDVNGVAFQRLNELYAANGQVGFRAYHRTDGKLLNTAAVKKLTMAAV